MSLYHRLAHLKDTPLVKVGDWVKRGHPIGYCGSTGNSTGAHLHYDILKLRPLSWATYVYGWAAARVRYWYADPTPYIKGMVPMDNSYPRAGYGFMQYVPRGGYFHPGTDINGVNDLGKKVFSPVEGRVVYVQGTTWIKNWLGKWVGKNYNSGWGNYLVIEEMPGFKL